MFRVYLTYFQRSGKYYSSGDYLTERKHLWEIFDEVTQKALGRRLPGLMEGHSDFVVHVDVPDHPHSHPALVL